MKMLEVAGARDWVIDKGLDSLIRELTDALEAEFQNWNNLYLTHRVAYHSSDGVIELMPSSDNEMYGFKLVNGHPSNPANGFQTVTAVGMLATVHNGYPTFVAEMTLLTALRTAATSALATRLLAPPDSRRAALIGTGAQSEFQAIALRNELGINHVSVYDVDPKAMEKFARNADRLGFSVEICDNAMQAARTADVITTCTADKRFATVLYDDDVKEVAHINGIGGDCPGKTELDPALLDRSDLVVVEYEPQSRIEGEIQHQGPEFKVTELHEIVNGEHPGRTADTKLTIFDSVGFAVEDLSMLKFALNDISANYPHLLRDVDLIANPDNPKDLYSLML
jgi:ornithine cyclodeaminase